LGFTCIANSIKLIDLLKLKLWLATMKNANTVPSTPNTPSFGVTAENSLMKSHIAAVVGQVDDWYFVQGIEGCDRAKQAVSCVIKVQVNDTVLVYCSADHSIAYIVSVLGREQRDAAVLALPGGVELSSQAGNLSIQAKAFDLKAGVQVSITSPKIDVTAFESEIKVLKLRAWFDALETQAINAKFAFQNLTTSAGRLLQRVRESFRWIEEVDETRAGRVRVKVEGAYQLQSRHATIHASGVVKVDGEKIDLG
jgi:hypothetical protein